MHSVLAIWYSVVPVLHHSLWPSDSLFFPCHLRAVCHYSCRAWCQRYGRNCSMVHHKHHPTTEQINRDKNSVYHSPYCIASVLLMPDPRICSQSEEYHTLMQVAMSRDASYSLDFHTGQLKNKRANNLCTLNIIALDKYTLYNHRLCHITAIILACTLHAPAPN